MDATQNNVSFDHWLLHPDDIATRYAITFSQRNHHEIGSPTYFYVLNEMQKRISTGIVSGELKLRTWPGSFVLPASTEVSSTTLIDLQEFCDSAEILGIACPKDAHALALAFGLTTGLSTPKLNKGTPPKLTDANKSEIIRLYRCRDNKSSVNSLAMQFNVSRPTIDRVLKKAGLKK